MRSPHEDYPAPTARRRLMLMVLAVAMAITIGWLLLYRPGGVKPTPPPPPADSARCQAGQQDGCVGGRALVITVPASAAR